MISTSKHGPAFRASDAALAQVGWIGQTNRVYGLDEKPADTEPGGFAPLYMKVGDYVSDGDGRVRLED